MKHSQLLLLCGLIIVATGCVSKKKFETTVSGMTTRIDGVQTTVEDQGQRISALDKRADRITEDVLRVDSVANEARTTGVTALQKAEEAAKAAKGKVIWQVTLTNRDLRFGADQAGLAPEGVAVLDQFIDRLRTFDKMVFVEIQGHTDSAGSEIYNQALGLKRAESVRDYLHARGIPLNLMEVISYGESKPLSDNATRDGRAINRRVEVLVLE